MTTSKKSKPESYNDITLANLRVIAEEAFALDFDPKATKKQLIQHLNENGATFDEYAKFHLRDDDEPVTAPLEEEDEPEEVEFNKNVPYSGKKVVLKLKTSNLRFEAYNYVFSRERPFVAMPEGDAQMLLDVFGRRRFEIATPKEVKEFYA